MYVLFFTGSLHTYYYFNALCYDIETLSFKYKNELITIIRKTDQVIIYQGLIKYFIEKYQINEFKEFEEGYK